jgi:HD-GYP domain-containing protein (c-di-GMP phosphodiesterase class II)
MKIDAYDTPDAEALLLVGEERLARQLRQRRELVTDIVGAAGFLLAALALAALAPWHRSLSPTALLLVLLSWVIIERVKFPVAGGWSYPTELIFVPALFILPTPLVPLLAALAIVLRRGPELIRGTVSVAMIPAFVVDAWFTIGPALVIVLAGAERFSWSHWPIYLLALVAQLLFDMAASIAWSSIVEGTSTRVQLPLMLWVYAVDAALAPLGLVIAYAAVIHMSLVLIALSPSVMLLLLARERQQRLDQTLALNSAYRGTALLLGDFVEADDHYTGMHSRDVVELSLVVSDLLGVDGIRRRDVEFAALLHDVGKIRIPKEIINKPGALSPDEWDVVRGHTIEGEKMLKRVGGTLAGVGTIVRHSHERYDGDGYPDGLVGDQIPIESRIICACDAYSAMTSDRAYRKALLRTDALAELKRCAGSQFDPQVVAAIEAVLTSPVISAADGRRPQRTATRRPLRLLRRGIRFRRSPNDRAAVPY